MDSQPLFNRFYKSCHPDRIASAFVITEKNEAVIAQRGL
jgi:hypothetical protein